MTDLIKKMLTAAEAARLLEVSLATLYSYVSRGLLASLPGKTVRSKLYAHDDVLRLAARRKDGRQAGHAVEQAIDWGKPLLESAITLIADGVIRYRGHDAIKLAANATLEQAAAILWGDPQRDFFAAAHRAMPAQRWAGLRQPHAHLAPLERAAVLLPAAAPILRGAAGGAPAEVLATGPQLMHVLAAALLDSDLSTLPLHRQMAAAWRLDASAETLIRAALVASADHELNVSTFTVRCVASTGAPLAAALAAGLAALAGPLHGGELLRVRAGLDAALAAPDAERALRLSMAEQLAHPGFSKNLPGFGHPLYANGDPRGALLLRLVKQWAAQAPSTHPDAEARQAGRHAAPTQPQRDAPRIAARIAGIAALASGLTGERPNIDFGLVAIERVLGLPDGAGQAMFALGRSAGWIAHAAEQRDTGRLIRPRARYVGSFDFPD